jgi:hypothetical protein
VARVSSALTLADQHRSAKNKILMKTHGRWTVLSFWHCRVERKKTESTHVNPRKTIIAILATLSASLALAEDFKTVNGKEYKDATVSRVEPDGIVVKTESGISKVYFTEPPKDVQERFGYDPERATKEAEKATKEKIARSWRKTEAIERSAIPLAVVPEYLAMWTYPDERPDEMGRVTKGAQLNSSNAASFGFPYQGEPHAALILRDSPKYGLDVMLKVERGQFVSSYTKNFVTVKFDDGELAKFAVGEPEDGKSRLLFIRPDDAELFTSHLRNAKSLKIETDFFQEGPRVFEFNVRGLNW